MRLQVALYVIDTNKTPWKMVGEVRKYASTSHCCPLQNHPMTVLYKTRHCSFQNHMPRKTLLSHWRPRSWRPSIKARTNVISVSLDGVFYCQKVSLTTPFVLKPFFYYALFFTLNRKLVTILKECQF